MKKILSVDGGGIRGVAPARLLSYLDNDLKAVGKPGVADAFDLFVGTSTGSLIAAGLAASTQVAGAPMTPDGLFNLYYTRGAEMFVPTPLAGVTLDLNNAKYQTTSKDAVLQSILGSLTLGEIDKNFLATFYSLRPTPGAVFAQGGPAYRGRRGGNPTYDSLLVSDVVNASSNAPMYFNPSAVAGNAYYGVDGGIFANNPAVCAYIEGLKLFPGEELLVVSVGCGAAHTQFPDWTAWGLIEWASPLNGVPLLEAIFDAQATTIDAQMNQLLDPNTYYRFQFDLPAVNAPAIDDVSRANLDAICALADAYAKTPSVDALMKELAGQL